MGTVSGIKNHGNAKNFTPPVFLLDMHAEYIQGLFLPTNQSVPRRLHRRDQSRRLPAQSRPAANAIPFRPQTWLDQRLKKTNARRFPFTRLRRSRSFAQPDFKFTTYSGFYPYQPKFYSSYPSPPSHPHYRRLRYLQPRLIWKGRLSCPIQKRRTV